MSLLYAITVSLMILVPVLLAIGLRRRFRAPWLLWTAGGLAFFLSQVYHLPLNNWLGDLGLIGPIAPDAPDLPRTAIVLGLSAGLCEGLMRVSVFWLIDLRVLVELLSGAVLVCLAQGGLLLRLTTHRRARPSSRCSRSSPNSRPRTARR